MTKPLEPVLVNGAAVAVEEAAISAFDLGFQRGYGCFEAMRAYDGNVFRLGPHLTRLERSASMLYMPLPDRAEIEAWIRTVAHGDCIVRVLVSAGTDIANLGVGSRVIVYATPSEPGPTSMTLQTRVAPWHSDGTLFELTGVKALSYGFNLAATLAARREGFDDALLVGESGHVLEGPTFSIGWVRGETLFTPGLGLGILKSITRTAVIEAAEESGFSVAEGEYTLPDLFTADEAVVMSTTREVLPVTRIDDRTFVAGEGGERLEAAFRRLVREETASR